MRRSKRCRGFDNGSRLKSICARLDNLENLRESVTVEDEPGLRLELDSGSPRIRIDRTVWEAGFGLERLFARLTEKRRSR